MEEVVKLGLCKGRHIIPQVDKYIFEQVVDPVDVEGITRHAVRFLIPYAHKEVHVYVTGLSVALIAVINAAITHGIDLVLWHFDCKSKCYYSQPLRSWN